MLTRSFNHADLTNDYADLLTDYDEPVTGHDELVMTPDHAGTGHDARANDQNDSRT
jgi:hypothetical protein